MLFTAEDAFDAEDCGEPIMITRQDAQRICANHYTTLGEYVDDPEYGPKAPVEAINAASLLAWLGYLIYPAISNKHLTLSVTRGEHDNRT